MVTPEQLNKLNDGLNRVKNNPGKVGPLAAPGVRNATAGTVLEKVPPTKDRDAANVAKFRENGLYFTGERNTTQIGGPKEELSDPAKLEGKRRDLASTMNTLLAELPNDLPKPKSLPEISAIKDGQVTVSFDGVNQEPKIDLNSTISLENQAIAIITNYVNNARKSPRVS